MGLAINGKVYGTSGVTYIGDNPIDCGYINEDGSPRYKKFSQPNTTTPSIFDLLTPGTYLTDYNKVLRYLTGMYGKYLEFMDGCFPAGDYVPVLIHVPENNLLKLDTNNVKYSFFAFFCFLIKYGKTDYSKDPDKKNKMDTALYNAYSGMWNSSDSGYNIIQPPADELDNFTFATADSIAMPIDDLYATYGAGAKIEKLYYKGMQVQFYQYNNTAVNNLANKIIVYLAGGYGVSIMPITDSINKYVFMGLANTDTPKIVAVYKCSDYTLYHNTTDKSPNPIISKADNHGYNIPTYSKLIDTNDTRYEVFKLYFTNSISSQALPHKDFEDGFTDYEVYSDVPYNPYIFSNLDIDNKYTWFADSYKGMITLAKSYFLNFMGANIFYGVTASSYYSIGNGFLPQGKYLINPKSVSGDINNLPCDPSNVLMIEAKSVDNKILEQRVYTDYTKDSYAVYYRRAKADSNNNLLFSAWDTIV